jgi:hypothetical protein
VGKYPLHDDNWRGAPPLKSSIRFRKLDSALDVASRIENTNLTGTETGAALRIIDCLTFLGENRLDARASQTFQPKRCGLISISIIAPGAAADKDTSL